MSRLAFLFVCLATGLALAQSARPSADEIMLRVAENQDRAESLRKQYVYQQHVHVMTRLTNGKLMREEIDDYDVVPTPDGSKKELKSRSDKAFVNGKYVEITTESDQYGTSKLVDTLSTDLVRDMVNDKSKDGVSRELFPLTTEEQKRYQFKLIGDGEQDGRSVYRVGFQPRAHEDADWKGEALIDKEDFEPVLVFTKLAHGVPLLVRGALGTDVPGVGFSVHYRRQPDGVWFPVSLGTEFRLKVLFAMKRNVVLSVDNRNFKRTHVDSKITGGAPE